MSAPAFAGWATDLSAAGESPAAWYLGYLLQALGAETLSDQGPLSCTDLVERLAVASPRNSVGGYCSLTGPDGQRFEVTFTSDTVAPGASDEAAWAWSGMASMTGDEWGAPLCPGAPLGSYCTALHALIPLIAGRLKRADTVSIALDVPSTVSTLIEIAGLKFAAEGAIRGRTGDWWGMAGWGLYDCGERRVSIALRDLEQLHVLARELDIPELLEDTFSDFSWGHLERVDEANAFLVAGLLDRDAEEVVAALRRQRIAANVVQPLEALIKDPHLRERGSLTSVGGKRVPALPLRISNHWFDGTFAPASNARPLEGLRVVDISTMWAGPMAARILAELGATVIKAVRPNSRAGNFSTGVEWDRDFYGILSDHNKQSVAVDFASKDDAAWLHQELARADVFIENFAVGALERAGFDHAVLHANNPRLVIVAMPAMGLTGPDAQAVGYGSTIEQAAGVGWLYSDEDRRPHRSGINFSDPVAGLFAAAGALLGLLSEREKCLVELSQQEASLHLMTGALARFQHTGQLPEPLAASGNEEAWHVPLTATAEQSVEVRNAAQVVGSPEQPGTRSVAWVVHPDGRPYPLPVLPWTGTYDDFVAPVAVGMPVSTAEARAQ